jgi:hypothetical protein
VDSYGDPSSGCKRWLILLGGIVRVVFELRTRWVLNVGTPNTMVGDEIQRYGMRGRK